MVLNERDFHKGLAKLNFHQFMRRLSWVSENGNTPLMFLFEHNKSASLNFTQSEIMQIVEQSDLKATNGLGNNALILLAENNATQGLMLSENQIFSIMERSDLMQENDYNSNGLHAVISHNKDSYLNLSYKPLTRFLQPIHFTSYDSQGANALSYILKNNHQLHLPNDTLCTYLNKVDLKHQDKQGFSFLMLVLAHNESERLGFGSQRIMSLIEKSDLKVCNHFQQTPFMVLLKQIKSYQFFKKEGFSKRQLKYIAKNSDLNAQDINGLTPLMYVAKYARDYLDFFAMLPQNLLLKDHSGKNILGYFYNTKNSPVYLELEKKILNQELGINKAKPTWSKKL